MEFSEYLILLNRKKQTIVSVLILFVLIAVTLTFIQPFQYEAKSSLLVVRDYTPGVDPYQVSKSNEYVAKVLAKVVNSNSFYNEIVNAGFNVNRNYFTNDVKKQRKMWQKTAAAGVASDSGIIELSVYHPDKSQADQILRAITATIKANHAQYHGAGDAIAINVIDQPFTSPYPVKPNIPANMLLALVFGLVFSFSYIYLFPEERFDLRLWPRGKRSRGMKEEIYYGNGQENEAGAYDEIEAARTKLRQGLASYAPSNNEKKNAMPYIAANNALDENYGLYYHKAASPAGNLTEKYGPAQDELGYEEIMKNGRMENVLGG